MISIRMGVLVSLMGLCAVGGCKWLAPPEIVGLPVTKDEVAKWGTTAHQVGQAKLDGDLESAVFEGSASLRTGGSFGQAGASIGTHKRVVNSKDGKVVEVMFMFDSKDLSENDDAFNSFMLLASSLTKQVSGIDLAKDDAAWEKLGLQTPGIDGKSMLKVNDNVALLRSASGGIVKFSAFVPGYRDR